MAAQHLEPRLKERRVEDRPEMDEPPEENEPEHGRKTKLNDRHQKPSLEQLPETGNEETAQRRDHVARRTLSSHGNILSAEKTLRNPMLAR